MAISKMTIETIPAEAGIQSTRNSRFLIVIPAEAGIQTTTVIASHPSLVRERGNLKETLVIVWLLYLVSWVFYLVGVATSVLIGRLR